MNCPKCGREVWDNRDENKKRREEHRKERPDFSCKDKDNCGWVQWPEKPKPVNKAGVDLTPEILAKVNHILEILAYEFEGKQAEVDTEELGKEWAS